MHWNWGTTVGIPDNTKNSDNGIFLRLVKAVIPSYNQLDTGLGPDYSHN